MYWVTANIQLVTILAALKQIENALFNSNVIKMIKKQKYHAVETIPKSSLGVYGVKYHSDIISVVSQMSVLLVEEIGVPRENYRPIASH